MVGIQKKFNQDLLTEKEGKEKVLASFIPGFPFLLFVKCYETGKKNSASTNSFIKCINKSIIISHMPKVQKQPSG